MNVITAHKKETPQSTTTPATAGHSGVTAVDQGAGRRRNETLWHFDLGLPSTRNCEKELSVVCKPPDLWRLVVTAQRK